jgi:hypothetical protein
VGFNVLNSAAACTIRPPTMVRTRLDSGDA